MTRSVDPTLDINSPELGDLLTTKQKIIAEEWSKLDLDSRDHVFVMFIRRHPKYFLLNRLPSIGLNRKAAYFDIRAKDQLRHLLFHSAHLFCTTRATRYKLNQANKRKNRQCFEQTYD